MQFKDMTVRIDTIDMVDLRFSVTFGDDSKALETSIGRIGLVNPPCLKHDPVRGMYSIVTGYRRLAALKNLAWQEVPARIVVDDPDECELFCYGLFDNLSHRMFNSVETARAAERLCSYYGENEVVDDFLPLLGLPPTVRSLEDMRAVSRLEPEVQELIVQGRLALKTGVRLAGLPAEDRRALFDLFAWVQLSSSKQTEVLDACVDIAGRDGIRIGNLVREPWVAALQQEDRLSPSQKGERVRSGLRKKRFPRLCEKEAAFARLKKELRLPAGMVLHAPPFFEGGTYRFDIAFKKPEDLADAAERAAAVAGSALLQTLLED
ncbi:MAG: ParB N-terminal domain-containing protein [Deltaproteobacteria bacterium]|nr:ParB N-terminal domain-containing protein [Deltaproteobacteria bacterium]